MAKSVIEPLGVSQEETFSPLLSRAYLANRDYLKVVSLLGELVDLLGLAPNDILQSLPLLCGCG